MNQAAQKSSSLLGQLAASEEHKPWEETTDAVKCQRLLAIVSQMEQAMRQMEKRINELRSHTHDKEGFPVNTQRLNGMYDSPQPSHPTFVPYVANIAQLRSIFDSQEERAF